MITVLLVDDEPELLNLTRLFLEKDNEISVFTCSSVSAALKALELEQFDAIISDYEMPETNGLEFLQQFRKTGDQTPFCIFTGRGREQVAIEALNAGADFYLQKGGDPKVQFAELKNMIWQSVKRRQAERSRQKSEEKYQFLADYSFNAVMILNSAGTILLANRMAAKMVELPDPAAMIGRSAWEFFARESQQETIGDGTAGLNRKGRCESRYCLQTVTGRMRWVQSVGTMIEFQGEPATIVSFRDLPDEPGLHQDGMQDEEEVARFVSALADACLITRHDGVEGEGEPVVWANRAATALLGYAEAELKEMTLRNLCPDATAFPAWNRLATEDTLLLSHKDGGTVRVSPIPLSIVWDQKPATILILRETKRSASSLDPGEERSHYRRMMDSIPAGVMLIDGEDHRIVEINVAGAAMIGVPAGNLIGVTCREVICRTEPDPNPSTDPKTIPEQAERVLIASDGSKRSILDAVSPLTIRGHRYLLESFVDITDRVKAEHAINQANRKLNILSSVTRHDILNQLTVLRGYLALAEDAAEESGAGGITGPYIQQIEKAARTIRQQIEFTRDYQDIGIQAPGWHRIDAILAFVKSKLDPGEVVVQSSVSDLEIYADPLVTEVFYNLLDNALRHAGRLTTISISAREIPEGLIISVADDGDGVPAEQKDQIFERGYGKNTGYGLFIIRDILDITGITIKETGIPGEGARFDLQVPDGAFRYVDTRNATAGTGSDQSDIPGTPY